MKRIVLLDDHPIVREHLSELINQQPDLKVCGGCDNGTDCLTLAREHKADLVIVDLSLKKAHGIEVIKDLRAQLPALRILVLSMHDEALYAERALRAGAGGYVTKQEATQTVLTAIRRVLAGELYLSTKMATQLVGALIGSQPRGAHKLTGRLTDRELEVFQLLGEGLGPRAIADRLKIDVKTIETYKFRIRKKLGCANAEQLRLHAVEWVRESQHP
jgi:DNA-binding NarL/FixJ family response regulator